MRCFGRDDGVGICKPRFMTMLLLVFVSLAARATCLASTISLTWGAVTDSEVAGYKVYYKRDSATLPLDGTGAVQGASPVDVANLTEATITGLDPAHPYYFAITAYNSAGIESPYSNLVLIPELIPPTASITYPGNNATVSGTVSVSALASDNVGVTSLEFYLNGVLQASDSAAPYLYQWNTAALASGTYTVFVKAYDAAGNVGRSDTVSVSVVNDRSAPTVALSAPANNATLSGTVALTADASDNVAVTRVEFYANGALLSASNVPPYSFNWNTLPLADGSYLLSAKAYDAAGNLGQSGDRTVTVANGTPSLTVSINPLSTPVTHPSLTISGSVIGSGTPASVTVQLGSGVPTLAASSGNSWNCQLTGLGVGNNLVTVRATDQSGRISTAVTSIVLLDSGSPASDPITLSDAQLALEIALGDTAPTAAQLARFDVAPYIEGQSHPNGLVDTGDVVVLLLKLVGKL